MQLKQAIIHELIKERKQKDRPEEPPVVNEGTLLKVNDTAVTTIVYSTLQTYGTKGNSSAQGTFDNDEVYTFPSKINDFIDSTISFKELTVNAMQNLKKSSKTENLATGGYLIFGLYDVKYNNTTESVILIAMVKKKAGITLQNLVPKTIQEVNLNQLHQAVKINLTRYTQFKLEKDIDNKTVTSYLSFISPKANSQTSGYFIEAIGCTDVIPDKEATKNTLAAVSAFFAQEPKLSYLKRSAREEIAQKLYQKSLSDDPSCELDTVDAWVTGMLPEEFQETLGNKFSEFANNEPYNVPANFKSNRAEAKKGVKLQLNAKQSGWSLNLDLTLLGEGNDAQIRYDKKNNKLIIKELPKNVVASITSAIESPEE